MPIDTTAIEGFEAMTAEQKVEALLKAELPDPVDLSGYVKKDLFDKTASELAEAKKALKGRLSEEEAAKAQAEADRRELEEKYAELLRRSTIAEHTARYLAMPGYDEKLARETAQALFDGDMDKVFANQQRAAAEQEKKLRAELVRQDPRPSGAGAGGTEDPAVSLAKRLGGMRAEAAKSAGEGIRHYLEG